MARSSSSSKKKKHRDEDEEDPQAERKRLKSLALSNKLVSEIPARPLTPLTPSNTLVKHHGKDIIKKSQRKNRFLFSFPGLLAPIAGGKIGDLKDLGTKNPLLYLDFPQVNLLFSFSNFLTILNCSLSFSLQGRMKLFGTIVFPKNKYLTLQFPRGGKSVMCEDYFDNMVSTFLSLVCYIWLCQFSIFYYEMKLVINAKQLQIPYYHVHVMFQSIVIYNSLQESWYSTSQSHPIL